MPPLLKGIRAAVAAWWRERRDWSARVARLEAQLRDERHKVRATRKELKRVKEDAQAAWGQQQLELQELHAELASKQNALDSEHDAFIQKCHELDKEKARREVDKISIKRLNGIVEEIEEGRNKRLANLIRQRKLAQMMGVTEEELNALDSERDS